MNLISVIIASRNRWSRGIAAGLIATAALTGSASVTEAAVIASDSFAATGDGAGGTYMTGNLYGQVPTAGLTGFTSGWGNANDTSSGNIVVQPAGLSHGLVSGSMQAGSISTASTTPVHSLFRELSTAPQSDAYYVSFLMTSSGSRRGALGLREEGNLQAAVTDSLGGVSVGFWGTSGIQAWVNGSQTALLPNYAVNETYFVLIEILDNGVGSNDTVNVNLYASGNTDLESPDASVSVTDKDISGKMTHLAMMKGWGASSDEQARFDEFRFGTSLESVAIPEPGALGLLGIGGMLVLRRPTSQG